MKNINKIYIFLVVFIILNSTVITGPVLLVGLDTECCGRTTTSNPSTYELNGHGTINQWAAIFNNMFANVTNGGTGGILVVCSSSLPTDNIVAFWDMIGTATSKTVTYVSPTSVPSISTVVFTNYEMIAVTNSSVWATGGVTQTALNQINLRGNDVAAFVCQGGALFGSTGSYLTNQFGYVAALGSISTTTTGSYGNPTYTLTPAGVSFGFPNTAPYINGGGWHNTFSTWPSFLTVLARTAPGAGPTDSIIAVGGMSVCPPPPNPVGDCCDGFIRNVTSTVSPNPNPILNYQVSATLNAGPNRIRKVEVAVVSLSIKHSNIDCQRCFNNPHYWGTLVPWATTSPLVPTSLTPSPTLNPINIPAYPSTPFGASYVNYRDFTMGSNSGPGILMSGINQKNIKFLISLQKPSLLQCCADTIDFCIRYKFTDTTCRVCDTLVCYKVINKGTGNPSPIKLKKAEEETLEKIMKGFRNKPEGQGYPGSNGKSAFSNISELLDTLLSCRSTGRSYVKVALLNRSKIKLTLYDANKKLVKEFDEQILGPDEYSFDFTEFDLPEGEYICRIETEEGTEERKFYWKEEPTCPCKRIKKEQEELRKENKQ